MTGVRVQVVTLACLNFVFKCDENKIDVILKYVVHRDYGFYFIVLIPDWMTKKKKMSCERNAYQPPLVSLTSGHCVGISHFLTEDDFIASNALKNNRSYLPHFPRYCFERSQHSTGVCDFSQQKS